jgi:DNA-directed RNA polymerase specialized sigma24 family protein
MRSDEKLALLVLEGRDDAFDALFARHRPGLLAFCEHALGSHDAARDVLPSVRDAARAALRGSDDCPACVKAELYRAARWHCGRLQTSDESVPGMHALPELERSALILRELDTLTYSEMARTLDTTEPVVKALLVQARVALAEARCAA